MPFDMQHAIFGDPHMAYCVQCIMPLAHTLMTYNAYLLHTMYSSQSTAYYTLCQNPAFFLYISYQNLKSYNYPFLSFLSKSDLFALLATM